MPVTFEVLPGFNLVLVHFRGEVGTEEHIESFLEYAAHPLYDRHQHALVDMADCTLHDAYFADMQRLAYRLKGYYAERDHASRTSVYAPGDVVYGMSRMYQSITDGLSPWETGVFRTRDEAMAFVDVAPESPQGASLRAIWNADR
ncbi:MULTISPECIES: hypothetical protein [Mameliella]|uniref:hypothetical protein n=1 Tax=Mameliella TaxID=1434019 RepID=UPI000B5322DF|nr:MULTISPECIES: hypothetical protein [Mameliella]MCR9275330.1 hypothetical protein [Paracoccaceae bacterium]OWV61101.1 hypothetical protein CDZ98_08715 [Mameliella alba]